MAETLPLREAVRRFVHDGDSVVLKDFTHLIPTTVGHKLIHQDREDLTLIRMAPDLVYNLLVGAGCAKKPVFPWDGNLGAGSLHRLCDVVEKGQPQPLEIEKCNHADLVSAYVAGASGLPFAVLRAYAGSDLPKINPLTHSVTYPPTGEVLVAVPSVRSDVSVIHAQKTGRKDNVLLWGILGMQKEAAPAAKRCIVIIEEIVDELGAPMSARVLSSWALNAVCLAPGGAHPSYTHGYHEHGNRFYQDWGLIAHNCESFTAWVDEYIRGTEDFGAFRVKLAGGKR